VTPSPDIARQLGASARFDAPPPNVRTETAGAFLYWIGCVLTDPAAEALLRLYRDLATLNDVGTQITAVWEK
jgi:hypothetical protein